MREWKGSKILFTDHTITLHVLLPQFTMVLRDKVLLRGRFIQVGSALFCEVVCCAALWRGVV